MIPLDVDNESGEPLKLPRRRSVGPGGVLGSDLDLNRLTFRSIGAGCLFTLLVIMLILTLRSSRGTGMMPANDPSFHDVLMDAKDNSMWVRLLDPVPVAAKYSSPAAADPESAATKNAAPVVKTKAIR